jgi:predicted nuclease of predicted toxin-antitoxin system
MKFKIDENLPAGSARLLREAGHDATTLLEQGHRGAPNSVVADLLRHEGRALITLDVDFADIRNYPPNEFPGIIVIRPRRCDREQISKILANVVQALEEEQVTGRLWVVDDKRLRIRGEPSCFPSDRV